jgi:prenyltransferase beta subunit
MSLRLEMLQAARLAPKALGGSVDLVRDFLLGQLNEDGGFRGRAGRSDLYYTVFGMEGLLALQAEFPAAGVARFLSGFDDPGKLDFVHLCCLARAWADVATAQPGLADAGAEARRRIVELLAGYRSADGGFQGAPQAPKGSAYAAFLALAAYQDCGVAMPETEKVVASILRLKTPDGAFTNDSCIKVGSTNATAAAIGVLRTLGGADLSGTGPWLLARCLPDGGFLAVPNAPIPDLLSTATALQALAGLGVDTKAIKEPCLDFMDSLWTNVGAFHGHWSDNHLDTEYTYYGLLALGHLAN